MMLAYIKNRKSTVMSMLMLYLGKASGLLITLFFIPFFHKIMGSAVFGYVAIVLSMQALLTMLDFGLSTLVGREFSARQLSESALRKLVDNAVLALLLFYFALLLFGIVGNFFWGGESISVVETVVAVLFFLFMVLQNIYYVATVSSQDYRLASLLQIIGNVIRAVATACALQFISPSFLCFVLSQALIASVHFFAAKYFFEKSVFKNKKPMHVNVHAITDAIGLLKKNKALAMYALAGAAVMQLDKPIIASFIGPSEVSAYYLAMTFCLVPASVLAAPVSQFFQPRVVSLFFEGHNGQQAAIRQVTSFSLILGGVVVFPTMLQWLIKANLLKFWLHEPDDLVEILAYTHILLPGVTIGALGYIPLSLLLAARDYAFQATVSTFFTVSTLSLALWAASAQNLTYVCIIYSCYHGVSTIVLWLRATRLPLVSAAAIRSGIIVTTLVFVVVIFIQILNLL